MKTLLPLLLLVALGLQACGAATSASDAPSTPPARPTPDPAAQDGHAPWAIAVVSSDYAVTAIGLIDRTTRECVAERVLDSGSSASGLSAALSGDVVLPSTWNPYNWLMPIDRVPNAAITLLDPTTFAVTRQFSVGTGFASNPHDLLVLSATRAYVTRYAPNANAGHAPYDGGDDILIVDPSTGLVTGRLAFPDAGTIDGAALAWMPDRIVRAGDSAFVSLNHLSRDFTQAGAAALAAFDTRSDTLQQIWQDDAFSNLGALAYAADDDTLYAVATGVFAAGRTVQMSHSALLALDHAGTAPDTWHLVAQAETNDVERPFGFDLTLLGDDLIVLRFGRLDRNLPDRVVAINRTTGEERLVYESRSAYGMGGLLADPATNTLYVGDADPTHPSVHRFVRQGDTYTADGELDTSPHLGLPPRQLRFY